MPDSERDLLLKIHDELEPTGEMVSTFLELTDPNTIRRTPLTIGFIDLDFTKVSGPEETMSYDTVDITQPMEYGLVAKVLDGPKDAGLLLTAKEGIPGARLEPIKYSEAFNPYLEPSRDNYLQVGYQITRVTPDVVVAAYQHRLKTNPLGGAIDTWFTGELESRYSDIVSVFDAQQKTSPHLLRAVSFQHTGDATSLRLIKK